MSEMSNGPIATAGNMSCACGDVFVEDEAIEELLPCFRRPARVAEHLPEFVDAIVCQSCRTLVVSGHDADDLAVGQVVIIADDLPEEIDVLIEDFGEAIDLVILNAVQHVSQIGLRIKTIHLGRSQ